MIYSIILASSTCCIEKFSRAKIIGCSVDESLHRDKSYYLASHYAHSITASLDFYEFECTVQCRACIIGHID